MIILEPETHTYSDDQTGRIYTSVSRVIEDVYPRKSWDGVNPAVIQNANERGKRVESYFNEYILTGRTAIQPGEREDVTDYVTRLLEWWEESGMVANSVQRIVSDEEYGIAGTIDILAAVISHSRVSGMIVDLKCVSQLQKAYKLQLGAYVEMSGADAPTVGLLHVTKKKVRLVEYDAEECADLWRVARSWWLAKQRLEVA